MESPLHLVISVPHFYNVCTQIHTRAFLTLIKLGMDLSKFSVLLQRPISNLSRVSRSYSKQQQIKLVGVEVKIPEMVINW